MTPLRPEELPAELELALAHSARETRAALRIFFEFDLRLGRIVAGTNEPMLGQMRLAWWRETLAKPASQRPGGDAVLDAIGEHWQGREGDLSKLVDGWECLLVQPPLSKEDAIQFLASRRDGVIAAFGKGAQVTPSHEAYGRSAWLWACADLAANVSDEDERAILVALGLGDEGKGTKAKCPDRGLAVLGALAHRALKRGGRPLMEGRGASLTALRAAFFGR